MKFWESFNKYVGVQGILAIGLMAGYIIAPFVNVVLPAGYTELATLTLGFYFAKNGGNVIGAFKKSPDQYGGQ